MLKKEARILGLSGATTHGRRIIVIVVLRGALWLDGVAACAMKATERNYAPKASRLIRRSKQFSQLHVVIVSHRLNQNCEASIQDLGRRVKLPIIALKPVKGSQIRGVKYFDIAVGRKHVAVSIAGVDRESAEKLYGIACSRSCVVPEAVRIADLVAEQLSRTFPNRGEVWI